MAELPEPIESAAAALAERYATARVGGVHNGEVKIEAFDEDGATAARWVFRYPSGAFVGAWDPDHLLDKWQDDREAEAADREELARWRIGRELPTLSLRAAQHAAEREGADADARALAAQIDDREAVGR